MGDPVDLTNTTQTSATDVININPTPQPSDRTRRTAGASGAARGGLATRKRRPTKADLVEENKRLKELLSVSTNSSRDSIQKSQNGNMEVGKNNENEELPEL